LNSPLHYTGGKSRLAKRIISRFPAHTCYCEVFAGAAWVFFGKQPSKVEVLNDRDGEVINLFRVVQNHYEEFIRQFKYYVVSRKLFEIIKRQDPFTLTDIQRAVKCFYIMKMSFAGKLMSPSFGYATTGRSGFNILDLEEKILEMHWRLASVYIENLDYKNCIERYDRPHTLFYLDPPYYGTKDYRHNMVDEDYLDLAKILGGVKGRFILSLGDHQRIREIFKGFKLEAITTSYSTGKTNESRKQPRAELLITNFKPAASTMTRG
jgi:DNA adenine methylase